MELEGSGVSSLVSASEAYAGEILRLCFVTLAGFCGLKDWIFDKMRCLICVLVFHCSDADVLRDCLGQAFGAWI